MNFDTNNRHMKTYRLGNTITIKWTISLANGEPFTLNPETVELVAIAPHHSMIIDDFTVDSNVLTWIFKGSEQKYLGPYTLTLIQNRGTVDMVTVDICEAFSLVPWSCMAGGTDDAAGVETESLEISSTLSATQVTLSPEVEAAIKTATDPKQDKEDPTLQTKDKTIPGAINEVKSIADTAQPKTDNTLQTKSKIIPEAINEIKKVADAAQPKEDGKGLSTNDYTNKDKENAAKVVDTIYGTSFELSIEGSYVSTNGTITNDGSSYRTDYISIDDFFRINGKGSFYGIGLVLAFFDENKTYISKGAIRGDDGNTLKEFDSPIPSGAKYAIVSAYGSTNKEQSYLQTSGIKGMIKRNILKNVLVFGDSITETKNITFASEENPYSLTYSYANTNWVDYFHKQQNAFVQFDEVRNYAKSGARFIKVNNGQEARQFIGFQIDEAIADLNAPSDGYFYGKPFEPDIVVVSMATNDYETVSSTSYEDAMSRSVIVGNKIDVDATIENLRTNIFAESVRRAFMRIRKQFPLAKMYMCLPIQRATIEFPEGILECLKKMSERYGITIINCFGESGITRDFYNVYLADGLHPNSVGKELMGQFIINRILIDNLY